MPIETGLTEDQRTASATAVRRLLAETYALYSKTHGYHWNVTGPRFAALHAQFESQYRELWAALDVLAERMRALDVYAPGSSEEMAADATIKPDNGVPDAEAMLANLARGHETLARVAREGVNAIDGADDIVTEDLLTQRADISEKAAWMLRASL